MTGANLSLQKIAGCSTEYGKVGEKQSKSKETSYKGI